jgi:hypothetical protein
MVCMFKFIFLNLSVIYTCNLKSSLLRNTLLTVDLNVPTQKVLCLHTS